jgi:FO synthase
MNLDGMVNSGRRLDETQLRTIAASWSLAELTAAARRLCYRGHGNLVSYSRKVFIPLTRLCRDVCGYCTFTRPPQEGVRGYLTPPDVLAIARAGEAAGCREALFTLGDKPELRYRAAREELAALGYSSTIDYLIAMCQLVLAETSLLPHANPGVMRAADIAALRSVTVSQGIMLESLSQRLCKRGGPHFGSPDKLPAVRLESIRLAGEAQVPFTSGILIGIGETRDERLDALIALRELHERHGHIQEVIIQSFRAKVDTRMASAQEPDREELLWTLSLARLVFGSEMNIQAPPNLSGEGFGALIEGGLNDWGGISPVTPDHVNPEAPWPALERLARETWRAGRILVERLAAYPAYCLDPDRWLDPAIRSRVLDSIDAHGFARESPWRVGGSLAPPRLVISEHQARDPAIARATASACEGKALTEDEISTLFRARGADFSAVCAAADALRQQAVGDTVRYVVNRNINYTNICQYHCTFCAFSKGKVAEGLRGPVYDLALEEVGRRAAEAWARGATEVCMQGGIHPDYTGETYLALCRAVKDAVPEIHIHAFSPLEIRHGADSLGMDVVSYLAKLKEAGLATLPGTAAEILDDEVRATLCPDKLRTSEWLAIVEAAHAVGLRTTSTIMFGHMEHPRHWARHLALLRALQARTGGITELVPLPFVCMEAPLYLKGRARPGPTFREAVLMHAVARLALHPLIPNIQVSWVKMGEAGVGACLAAGASDLGGTLMNESISRAAGASHGQEWAPQQMERVISCAGRIPQQRTTLYGAPPAQQSHRSYVAAPLLPPVQTPANRARHRAASAARLSPGTGAA